MQHSDNFFFGKRSNIDERIVLVFVTKVDLKL